MFKKFRFSNEKEKKKEKIKRFSHTCDLINVLGGKMKKSLDFSNKKVLLDSGASHCLYANIGQNLSISNIIIMLSILSIYIGTENFETCAIYR